jgi:hypothetical protein
VAIIAPRGQSVKQRLESLSPRWRWSTVAQAASFEVLQFLSVVIAPSGISDVGSHSYHFVTGGLDTDPEGWHDGCPYSQGAARARG